MVLAGCTSDGDGQGRGRRARRGQRAEGATERKTSEQDPDIAVAAEALAGELAALDTVQATLQRHAALAELLDPVRDAHQAHAALLAEAVPGEQPSEQPSEAPGSTSSPVPRSRRAALRRLARAEAELSTGQKQRAFAAQSGAFARLLASMSASAGQYAVALDPARPQAPGTATGTSTGTGAAAGAGS